MNSSLRLLLFLSLNFFINFSFVFGAQTQTSFHEIPDDNKPLILFEFVEGLPTPKPDYDDLVQSIVPGTKLQFLDGAQFTVTRQMYVQREGELKMTGVYAIAERNLALRISLRAEAYDLIRSQAEGYKDLRDSGVPVTQIQNSPLGEYLLAEMLPSRWIPMSQFLEQKLSENEMRRAEDALLRFAWASARFEEIGDFNDTQLALILSSNSIPSEDKWVLFDWTESHRLWRIESEWPLSIPSQNPFSHGFFVRQQQEFSGQHKKWVENLLRNLENKIHEARISMSSLMRTQADPKPSPSFRDNQVQIQFLGGHMACASQLKGKVRDLW